MVVLGTACFCGTNCFLYQYHSNMIDCLKNLSQGMMSDTVCYLILDDKIGNEVFHLGSGRLLPGGGGREILVGGL